MQKRDTPKGNKMASFQTYNNLDEIHAKLSKTIKKRQFYVESKGLKIRRRYRPLNEIISKYTHEVNEELNGFYRTHLIQYQDCRKYWQEQLMQEDYSFLLSIKLPPHTQSGFRRTRNRGNAKKQYRILIKKIIQIVINKTNHWDRTPLQFVGVLEHGEDGFWHVHLLIKPTNNDEYIGYKLCDALNEITNEYKFYKNVFDLRVVYDKEGICAYMVKELTDEIEDENKHVNEGSELFTVKTWFGIENLDNFKVDYFKMNINYFDINQLLYVIPLAAWLKYNGGLQIPNPINKLRRILAKKSAHNVGYGRQGEIQSTANFDLFGRPVILFDSV